MKHGNYISIKDSTSRLRFLCFKEHKDANKCVSHIADFRSKYGYFPAMDLGNPQREIKSKVNFKKRTKQSVERFFEIEMLNEEDFESLCNIYSMNILYCHSFDVEYDKNKFELLLTAQEIDTNPNSERFRKMLDSML